MAAILTAIARASTTFTWADVPHADDTFVVGKKTYTWKATPGATANAVKIGADVALSIAAAVAAINASTATTLYGTATTANADAIAAVTGTGEVTVYARTIGVSGNLVNTAEGTDAGSHLTVAAAACAGGVGQLEELMETALTHLRDNVQLNSEALSYVRYLLADLAL